MFAKSSPFFTLINLLGEILSAALLVNNLNHRYKKPLLLKVATLLSIELNFSV